MMTLDEARELCEFARDVCGVETELDATMADIINMAQAEVINTLHMSREQIKRGSFSIAKVGRTGFVIKENP